MTAEKKARDVHLKVDKAFDDSVSEIVFIKRRFLGEVKITRRAAISFSVIETANRLRNEYLPTIKN